MDLLIRKILDSKFYRERVPDTYVTARTYLHPPGSGLDWHDDEGRFAGAYTYYVHPRWHASWGGELMIVEDMLGRGLLPDKRHMREGRVETVKETWDVLTKDDLSQLLMDGATSTEFVFAKPNRLVFMVGGVWHRVNVVKRNAPFARAAIAGFFLGDGRHAVLALMPLRRAVGSSAPHPGSEPVRRDARRQNRSGDAPYSSSDCANRASSVTASPPPVPA